MLLGKWLSKINTKRLACGADFFQFLRISDSDVLVLQAQDSLLLKFLEKFDFIIGNHPHIPQPVEVGIKNGKKRIG